MKRMICAWMFGFFLLAMGFQSVAQTDAGSQDDEETYFKKNLAVTDFSRVGVNGKQFTKGLKTVNFSDPEKTMKIVMIGKEEFRDDGLNYDQVANDGFLTSKVLYNYSPGEPVLSPGEIRAGQDNQVVYDQIFEHNVAERLPWPPRIRIQCDVRWVPCSALPYPANQICTAMGPPYGSFQVYNCEVELTFF